MKPRVRLGRRPDCSRCAGSGSVPYQNTVKICPDCVGDGKARLGCRGLRERQKQTSRDADERLPAAGVPAAGIEAKNALLRADRTIVHWDRSKPL